MKDRIRGIIEISSSTDKENTLRSISRGINIEGYNAWLLVLSALLACIGLDTNSSAVIIGAMLISPLMSPILGVGLFIGINDRESFLLALKNLGLATLLALATACIYFLVTPLGEITNEITARTQPTLLDVGVAFFGGVAGIIAGSRRERENAIPGVAIATALMPPLCTAGFGIATGRPAVFFGAFYLFFINAVFISIATFLIVIYLKFPLKSYIDKGRQKKVARLMSLILMIVILPSVYFLYQVYTDLKVKKTIRTEVVNDLKRKKIEVLNWHIEKADSVNQVKIYTTGRELTSEEITAYGKAVAKAAPGLGLSVSRLNLTKAEIESMSSELLEKFLLRKELALKAREDSIQKANRSLNVIEAEIRTLFPSAGRVGFGKTVYSGIMDTLHTVVIGGKAMPASEERRLYEWLRIRLKTDTLQLIFRKG
jgi:uncharacterized hydrophobic protein (TIGR00271 family)